MISFNTSYSKYVYLPSGGGASYSPDCFLNMVNTSLNLLHVNANLYNTEFEYVYQVLKNHCDKNIEELYLFDFYYLWFVLKSNFIKKRTNETFTSSCSKCSQEQKIGLDFENLIVRQNKNQKIEPLHFDNINKSFRPRMVTDNLRFPYLSMNARNVTEKIITYVWQQCIDDVPLEYFQNIHLREILEVYIELSEYNKVFGIYDNLSFNCCKCETKNNFSIFNDFSFCAFSFGAGYGESDKLEFYKNILQILQTKIINTNDYFTIPYKDTSAFFGAFNQLDFSLSQRFM
jgi:hypothetical protein